MIVIAGECIAAGLLRQPALTRGFVSATPFADLAAGAAWDDIVSYYFQCRFCGQGFRLGAETYHGGGGRWEVVSRLPDDAGQ